MYRVTIIFRIETGTRENVTHGKHWNCAPISARGDTAGSDVMAGSDDNQKSKKKNVYFLKTACELLDQIEAHPYKLNTHSWGLPTV